MLLGGLIGFKMKEEMYRKELNVTDLNDTSLETGIYFVRDSSTVANAPLSLRFMLIQLNGMSLSGANSIGQIAFPWSSGPSFGGIKNRAYFNNTWSEWT